MGLTFPTPIMMLRQWSPGPMPKELLADREGYRRALTAVRKVPEPSRQEGRAYVRYWIGRLEFAIGYLDAIESVKRAATARQAAKEAKVKNDTQGFRTNLAEAAKQAQVARTTAFRAIEAYAKVAKNRADLGAIATLAEYAYRPLKRKAEALRAENAKAATSDRP